MADTRRPNLLARMAGYMGIGPWRSSPGPYSDPAAYTDEGWVPYSWPLNFGQIGYDPIDGGWNAVVYSCIMLYARTIAQLPGQHRRVLPNNAHETVTNSALSRILLKPNDYQTRSDFLLNMVTELLSEGNAYAFATRNARFEVDALYQMPSKSCRALYAPNGEVFYSVGGNPILDYRQDPAFTTGQRWIIPQRDILHFCGPSKPNDPKKGESPLVAGGLPIMMSSGGGSYFGRFYKNMSRPSGVLSTENNLTGEQVAELRKRWDEVTKGPNIGGTPILSNGLKWQQTAMTSTDMQIAESMKLSKQDIAMIFGVPLALVNDMTGATYNNVENLIMMWLRQGLGYYVDAVELAFDKLFGIERDQEYTYLDIDEALLRPDFKTRIEGYARAVQGGIYAPDEAREKEGLKKVDGGAEPRVQQQMVPLSYGAKMQPAPLPAPPVPASNDNDGGEDGGTGDGATSGKLEARVRQEAILERLQKAEEKVAQK